MDFLLQSIELVPKPACNLLSKGFSIYTLNLGLRSAKSKLPSLTFKTKQILNGGKQFANVDLYRAPSGNS